MRRSALSFLAVFTLALGACDPGTSSSGSASGTTGGTGSVTAGSTGTSPATSPPTTGVSTTGSNPSGSVTTDDLPPGSGCCQPHEGPGCNEAAVQTCVCDMDASCCGFDWQETCVDLAQARCDATCQPDMTTTDSDSDSTGGRTSGPTGGDDTTGGFGSGTFGTGFGTTGNFGDALCCYEGTGCDHLPTEECVCDIDPSCCDGEWSQDCVGIASDSCNACTSNDCCTPQNDAGCADVRVEDCVCGIDPYCCDNEYDFICAEIAEIDCKACAG